MRAYRVIVPLALALVALTGCVPFGFACTAVGYGSTVRVTLAEPRPGLTLELCDGEGCEPGPVEQPTEVGATATQIPTGIMSLTGASTTGWSASLLGGQPELGYRLTDEAGVVVAEGTIAVDWVRIDGTEQCGGNRAADVELPA